MRNGAILSGLLHGLLILFLFIGLPDFLRRDLEPPPVIPIEIINIADITQAPALKVKPKDDAPKEEPKEKEKPTPPKPTPPEPEKQPEPEPEKKPEPEPEPTPEPELTMDDLLAPIEEEKIKEEKPKEKPQEKPKEKPKDKKKDKKKDKPKKKKRDFTSLLNNIEKTESSSEGITQPEQDENSTADHAANNIGELSVTELDLIRRQLQQCWNVPAGAKDGNELNVDIKIELNPDATIRSAVILKTSKPMSDPHMRALADSAHRAVKNPKCSPLKLPLDRYEEWKAVTIGFNPKNML